MQQEMLNYFNMLLKFIKLWKCLRWFKVNENKQSKLCYDIEQV